METANEALQVQLDIDLTAGKINAESLVGPFKQKLDKIKSEVEGSTTISLEKTFDAKKFKGELDGFVNQVDRVAKKAQKQLGSSLKEGDFAAQFLSELKKTPGILDAEGKVIAAKAREVFLNVAKQAKIKGEVSKKSSTHEVLSLLGIDGKAFDEATAFLQEKSAQYKKAIANLSLQGAEFQKATVAPLLQQVSGVDTRFRRGHATTRSEMESTKSDYEGALESVNKARSRYQLFGPPGQGEKRTSEKMQESVTGAYVSSLVNGITVYERLATSGKTLGVPLEKLKADTSALWEEFSRVDRIKASLTKNFRDMVVGAGNLSEAYALLETQLKNLGKYERDVDLGRRIAREAREAGLMPGKSVNKAEVLRGMEKELSALTKVVDITNLQAKLSPLSSDKLLAQNNAAALEELKGRVAAKREELTLEGKLSDLEKSRMGAAQITESKPKDSKERLAALNAEIAKTQSLIDARILAQKAYPDDKENTKALTAQQQRIAGLQGEAGALRKLLDLSTRIKTAKGTSLALRAGEVDATNEEQLSAVKSHIKSIRAIGTDLKLAGDAASKEDRDWAANELRALRTKSKILEDAIAQARGTKTQGDITGLREELGGAKPSGPMPVNVLKAEIKRTRAQETLADSKAHLEQLPDNATARERLQLLTAQRNNEEAVVRSLRELIREEQKAYEAQLKLYNQSRAKFGEGAGGPPKPPDFSIHNAEIAKHNKAVKGLNEQLSGLDNLWNKISQSMGLFLRYAVIYKFFYALTSSITSLVQSVIDLQGALTNIKAVTNATASQMGDVAASIKNVAKSTSFSTADVAKGAQTLVQAGIPLKDFATTLKATADLSSSTASGFQETADVISTYKQVYKDMDVQTIADKIRNAVNISKLDMQGVHTMSNYILETAEAYKVSIDSMLGALTTLRNAGIKDSTAGTGLRQGILELLSPDDKTLKALQVRYSKLGINMSQEAIKSMFAGFRDAKNPILAVVNELQKLGMGGTGENDLARVFDVRAENVIKTLVQNKEAFIANEVAMRQTGTAAEGAKTQLEGLKNSFQNLGETVVSIAHSASSGFIDDIVGMLHTATDMLDKFAAKVAARKAETGDTGLGSALTTGVLTTGLSLAGKASVGVSAVRGVLAAVVVEIVKVFAPASGAVQNLAKAAESAATALGILALIKSVPKGAEKIGRVTLGDRAVDFLMGSVAGGSFLGGSKAGTTIGEIAIANQARSKAAIMKTAITEIGVATEVASGGLATLAKGLSGLKALGGRLLAFGRGVVGGYPGLIAAALYFAWDYFDIWSKVTGKGNAEKLAEVAKAKQEALDDQAAELKKQQKESEDLARESKVRRENQALLRSSVADMESTLSGYTNNSPVEITREVNGNQITDIMSRAAKSAVALGTKQLEAVAKQIEDKMGATPGSLSRYNLASDLQKLDVVFQQVESARKTYIESLVKAQEDYAKNKEDLKAKSVVDAWGSLSDTEKRAVQGIINTTGDVKSVVDAMGKASKEQNLLGKDVSDAMLDQQYKQVNLIRAQITFIDGRLQTGPLGQMKSLLLDAVQKGAYQLVEYIVKQTNMQLAEVATKSGSSAPFLDTKLIQVAKENLRSQILEPFLQAQKANANLAESPEKKISPSEFEAGFTSNQDQSRKVNLENAEAKSALEADITKRREELDALVAKVQNNAKAFVEAGVNVNPVTEADKEKLAEINQSIADSQAKIAALRKEELTGEESLAAAQRGFVVGEGQIKALQDKLKVAHTARLHSVEEEVGILREIHDIDAKQLDAKKAILARTLASLVEKETNLDTKGLSPEELLKVMSGDAGKAAIEKSKELSDAYGALAEVIYKQKDLEEKFNTDVDNAKRKDLEAKEKVAKSAYDKQTGKTTSLESKLQTTTDRLIAARDKLREAYEKQADLEDFFDKQLREFSGEKKTAKDAKITLTKAKELGSSDVAKQAAEEVKALFSAGDIGRSEAESLTKEARQIAMDAQASAIERDQQNVIELQQAQATLTVAVDASRASQERLKQSLDGLTEAIAVLNGTAEKNGKDLSKTDQYGGQETGRFGGPLAGDAAQVASAPNEWVSAKNTLGFNPGSDTAFMSRLRSTYVSQETALGVSTPLGVQIPDTTASSQPPKQPIMFNVGGNVISAEADADVVEKFSSSMRMLALKQGRKS